MSEILDSLLTECSDTSGHKRKIEKIITEEKKVIENLPEENKKERIQGIIKYAKENNMILVSINEKHFKPIKNLILKVFKP